MHAITTIVLPPPISICIIPNTFIRYVTEENNNIHIGLVTSIRSHQISEVQIRRFLTWAEVVDIAGESLVPNISFWPLNSVTNPHYLCDSDLLLDVSISNILGLAFVFYYQDNIVKNIEGMMHTYIVSSYFHSKQLTITHTQTFVPFPSSNAMNQCLSCVPSTIFHQLLLMKQKILLLLNTRSLAERCNQSSTINNVDRNTWHYITSNIPILPTHQAIVYKKTFLFRDEFCVEKYRTSQFVLDFSFPGDLPFAQKLFGSGVGIGTRRILRCSLKQRGMTARVGTSHQLTYSDVLNIVPFEEMTLEEVRRGLQIKYIPSEMEMNICVKYRVMSGQEAIQPELEMRNLPNRLRPCNPTFDDYYTFFGNTSVFEGNIIEINLRRETVTLSNRVTYTILDVINELDRLL